MSINSKAIIRYWKTSLGLDKSVLEKMGTNQIEDILENQNDSLDILQMDLNDINETMNTIKEYINTVKTILAKKYKDEEENDS